MILDAIGCQERRNGWGVARFGIAANSKSSPRFLPKLFSFPFHNGFRADLKAPPTCCKVPILAVQHLQLFRTARQWTQTNLLRTEANTGRDDRTGSQGMAAELACKHHALVFICPFPLPSIMEMFATLIVELSLGFDMLSVTRCVPFVNAVSRLASVVMGTRTT
jgi:hypothetical protein